MIVQTNPEGDKHVMLTQDMLAPISDFVLSSPGWENSTVNQSSLLLLCMNTDGDCMLPKLLETELRSADSMGGLPC